MPVTIDQSPLYTTLPVGQEVIFVVANNNIVALQTKVKFIAEVYIGSVSGTAITSGTLVGVFKTTPNNRGVGIFDFNNIVENYVKADNMADKFSEYKGTQTNQDNHHPIHLIDKFSTNNNAVRFLGIIFKIEYLGATNCSAEQNDSVVREACGEEVYSDNYILFNGYVKETDVLTKSPNNNNFGYDIDKFSMESNTDQFLSNAPTTQYATTNDYGVCAFLALDNLIEKMVVTVYHPGGSEVIDFDKTLANGAYDAAQWSLNPLKQLLYFGFYPANLRQNTTFNSYISTMTHYDVHLQYSAAILSQTYTVNILCPDLRGYDPIRLAWLNQWGAWDYYTFNKKSIRSIKTKGTTYEQLQGTWNEDSYRTESYKGGKKSFRVNATEKIKINTDFVSEDYNTTFEELINSPEVYILEGFQTDITNSLLNQYVTPVRLTTSNFTRKTIANDKLIQYTFDLDKTKILRTQSV
jgi:hypothetical protein|tara:strand:- start:2833 stop:4230 length:1398 start_codon:yes stop_codon:yes gene_type:complete